MHSHQRDGHIDVEQHPTCLTMHVVMPFNPPVIPAGLVGESQLLDQAVLRKQVQRAVDRAVPDMRVVTADTLEDLSGCEMRLRPANHLQHCGTLSCVPEPLTWHDRTFRHSR